MKSKGQNFDAVALIMNGIYCLDNTGGITPYTMGKTKMRTNSITAFSCANGIDLYIGTSSGLYCMNTETKEISLLESNDSTPYLLEKVYINSIYQDTRGFLWIGTRTGIYIYDGKTKDLAYLSTKEGLSHNYIRAIIEDKNKDIWVTTDHGITNILVSNNPKYSSRFICYPYFEEDGIGNMSFNNHSIACTRQGEILMGGSDGYLRINPNTISHQYYSHPVIYTGLFLANRRIGVGDKNSNGRTLLKKNIQLLNEITMDYSDSYFTLEVSSMDYASLHKLQYVYRLNENEKWLKLEGNRIHFNKLSPGTYQLEVKVFDNNNYKNTESSRLIIHVLPPFWLSVPAYICYALLVLSIIIFCFLRMKKKHIRNLERQRHEMEIIQQQEMNEARIRFFTNVSHDLRTPLSLIIIPLEKLLTFNLEKKIKEEIELIYRNSKILLREVNQLLDFRKLDQQQTQLVLSYGSLSDFVKEIYTAFSPQAVQRGINIHLHINVNEVDLSMDFDRNKVQSILNNLLSNAVKYNHEKGEIIITLDTIIIDEKRYAQIQVADTGFGIKDENKDKIFDRFFQEQHSAVYTGNGIGLHIVKEYVALHHGIIEVKNNYPQGSVFNVKLPIYQNHAVIEETKYKTISEKKNVENASGTVNSRKVSLLIVEDNNDFRQFLINSLKEHYHVFNAPDGKKALEILDHQSIQIVISDVMMPVMDGIELCRIIKTNIRYSHIPVILLTARTADEHQISGLKEGADDYITKPFNMEILLIRIEKLLKWTENNHERFKTIDISPSEITLSSPDEDLIEKAIRAVEENMDNSAYSVEELSSHVGMSRGHLYKKLISITGKSPVEFIRILRLKRGKQLLEQTQLSVSEISYQIGITPKLFSRYFKEEFGYSPSEYRKLNTNDD